MGRLIKIFVLLCTAICLTACGEPDIELSGATYTIDVLIDDTHYLQLSIPMEVTLQQTDNHSYFAFDNGMSVYLMKSKDTTAKYDEMSKLYIASSFIERDFDNNCVVVNASGSLKEAMVSNLSNARIVNCKTDVYKELRMEKLPDYIRAEMYLVDNMYMPNGCEKTIYDIYDAELYTEGTLWLQCWIVDKKFEDTKDRLMSLALLGTGKENVDGWYMTDDIFYCYCNSNIVAAKRLAFNSWYVYYGHVSMKDYILTGIEDVHG